MPESPKNALPMGHVIDKYRIGDVLGSGGFGIVYRAQHEELGLDVALKEYLPPEIAVRDGTSVQPLRSESRGNYDEGLRRFLEEAKRLVQFNHPNVARCRDFFRANGTAYLVMDFEDGLPLSELLSRREEQGNPLSGNEVKQIILPLLDGLAVVHAHDVLHRDIKPGNIFIRRSTEQPVLIDFGAAKQGFSEHSKSVWAYTQGYAPMEQIEQDGKLGPWTDIYAIGAVMWRIVAGDSPPRAEDRMSAQVRGNPDPMKPAAELGDGKFSIALLRVIDKCLSLQEKGRYQSAENLKQALHDAKQPATSKKLTNSGPKAAHPNWHASDNRVIAWTIGMVIAGAVLGAIIGAVMVGGFAETAVAANEDVVIISAMMGAVLGAMMGAGLGAVLGAVIGTVIGAVLAERVDAEAQWRLGYAYWTGKGVPKNSGKAVRWWHRSAEQGYAQAQFSLGMAYHYGMGVPNYREAYIWHSLAAMKFNTVEGSIENLLSETAADLRDEAASELSAAELSAAQSEVKRRSKAISRSP